MELRLFQSIFRDILYNGQEWKRFPTKVPVLYIFVPLAMIEIVNRRWGAWQSGFMGSSPPSPPLALQHHRLTVLQNFERIFQHIFQWDRGGVALRKSFGAVHYCNARDPTICLSAHFW